MVDMLITDGARSKLFIAMVGWVGAGKEMVGKYAGQGQRVGRCRRFSRVRGDTPITPDKTAVQVRSSG